MNTTTSELFTLENLFSAWDEFKIGKQQKSDVLRFERNLEDNIFLLYEELSTKTYKHQGYHTFHVYDPKFRVINKATVRDRVVHHLVLNYLERLFQPTFIYHYYSCQKGKGIHMSVNHVDRALRKVSKNYGQKVWSLKMDIKKFFASVDHEVLFSLLCKRLSDPNIFWLIENIIQSFHTPDAVGKGMPIGNLTSQIFANVYLSELDYFAKHNLREKYYFRYADDFLFLHSDRSHLEQIQKAVEQFVTEKLHLTVHPNKVVFRSLHQGIDWLGYVLRPHYRVLRTRTKQRIFKKMHQRVKEFNRQLLDESVLEQTMQSYLGILSHCNARQLSQRLQNDIWIHKIKRDSD